MPAVRLQVNNGSQNVNLNTPQFEYIGYSINLIYVWSCKTENGGEEHPIGVFRSIKK